MAPTRSKKRKSTESTSSVDVQNFPAPPQLVATKTRSPVRTPTARSPIKKVRIGITVGQKQALIDNLQLEVTERARKLRAQYMHQASVLRSRIEIRVHRIPMAMRKVNMGELLLKHDLSTSIPASGPSKQHTVKSPAKNLIQEGQSRASPSPQRGHKRMSDDISVDKENEDIENPKKRARGEPIVPGRTTSKLQTQVLSPRSANSRSMPRSPIRTAVSPGRSQLARPVSPLKPVAPTPVGGAAGILTNMIERTKATRGAAAARKATDTSAGAGRGKRVTPAASAPKFGRGRAISSSSDSSTTTVVRKPGVAKKVAPVKEKKTVMSSIKGMASQKKMTAGKPAAAPTTGGRVLRKRN